MHICTILPHIKEYGGVRRYLEFGNSLIRKGHRNTLFVLEYDALANFKWIDELKFVGGIKPISQLNSEVFDACICGDAGSLHYLNAVNAKLKVVNVISPPWTNLPMANYNKYLYDDNYLVVGNSTDWNGTLDMQKHWSTIPGAINTDMFHPVPVTKNAKFSILFMAKHRPWKNLKTILKSYEFLKDRNYEWGWFDTERHPELPADMKAHLNVQQKDFASLFSKYHCFVSVETIAGWQNTAMEAMACGIAVVCTEIGTKDFAINRKTAYVLQDTNDYKRLSDYIETLASNANLRSTYGTKGISIAKTLTWDNYTDVWIDYLEKHLAKQKVIPSIQEADIKKVANKIRDIANERSNLNTPAVPLDAIVEKARKLKNFIASNPPPLTTTNRKQVKKEVVHPKHSKTESYRKSLLTLVQNTKKVHSDCPILTIDAGSFSAALKSLKFETYIDDTQDFKNNTRSEILLVYKIKDVLSYDTFNLIQKLLLNRKLESIIIGTTDVQADEPNKFISAYKELQKQFLLTYVKAPGGYFLIMENREIAIKKYLLEYNFHYMKPIVIEGDDTYDALIKVSDKVLQGITEQLMNLVGSGISVRSL